MYQRVGGNAFLDNLSGVALVAESRYGDRYLIAQTYRGYLILRDSHIYIHAHNLHQLENRYPGHHRRSRIDALLSYYPGIGSTQLDIVEILAGNLLHAAGLLQ